MKGRGLIITYSKMHQNKYAYKLEINIKETRCPVCKRYHLHMSEAGLITCQCGFIADNTHQYVAGAKLNNTLNFKIEKKYKEDDHEEKKE